ncbi:N(6)-adenine-specific methyltransferase METTL4-like [Ornithodoros turicata]|uniref:N(6)-adenine-specific methyltransferase METTL4-like n=1 Tax=Ornithodoros turicata TaxID=34597 RepID=UPI00313A0A4E
MAVLVESDIGWFVSHAKLVRDWYRNCRRCNGHITALELRNAFFDIAVPFQMDSAAQKHASLLDDATRLHREGQPIRKPRRKKRQHAACAIVSFLQNPTRIAAATEKIVEEARKLGHFFEADATSEEIRHNNKTARIAASQALDVRIPPADTLSRGDNDVAIVVSHCEHQYAIPVGACPRAGDVQQALSQERGPFDLIVADPPWDNRSVRRKNSYVCLGRRRYEELLLQLPVARLGVNGGPPGLVVVWCTHNASQLEFVVKQLLPAWGTPFLGVWYWVKVTRRGVPVRPIGGVHKQPVEYLVFGGTAADFPDHRIVVSVPSSIHSHKFPLTELLKPWIGEKPRCLELFARYLVPHWTSIGDEVLKLQRLELYEEVDDPTVQDCQAPKE